MARQDRVWLLAGLNEIDRSPQSNVAVLFNPQGAVAVRYAKRHLAGALESDYQPGDQSAIVDAPWGRTAIAIGEDLDHPELGREFSMRGVRFVLVPAWDVSGSESIRAPMTSLWAIINGISVARAAREGVARLVDSRGRTIAQASSRGADPGLA